MNDEELKKLIDDFVAGKVQPKVMTLAQDEQLDDCIKMGEDNMLRPDINKRRRLLLLFCYGIPNDKVGDIPSPVYKDMLEKATKLNASTSERENLELAQRRLRSMVS